MRPPIRVAVLGAGKMGAHHARVFAGAHGAALVGVFDVNRERAATVACATGTVALRTEVEAIELADLVVIATPTVVHFPQAKRVLEARRHALVEKPLCERSSDADALCELARAHGARLFVGHSERFNPVIRAIRRATEGEALVRMSTRRAARSAGDDLALNLAVHDIDLAAFLSRNLVELESASGDGREAVLRLRAGLATIRVSVGRSELRVRTIDVQTDAASYAGDLVAERVTRDGVSLRVDHTEPLALQAQETIDGLHGARVTVADGDEGARAVALASRAEHVIADLPVFAAE